MTYEAFMFHIPAECKVVADNNRFMMFELDGILFCYYFVDFDLRKYDKGVAVSSKIYIGHEKALEAIRDLVEVSKL